MAAVALGSGGCTGSGSDLAADGAISGGGPGAAAVATGAGAARAPSGSTGGSPGPGSSPNDANDEGANGNEDAIRASDAGPLAIDAASSNKILIYAVTPAPSYRHDSIPTAADAIAKAAGAVGLTVDMVGTSNATNKVDATKFTAAALTQYGAIILLATDGEPFGYPATAEIQNLSDYVQSGGALVGIECSTDCYGGGYSGPMNGHPLSLPYHQLLGATFLGHSAFAPATCTKVGNQASVDHFADTFRTTDEIYQFGGLRMDNQIVLNCTSSTAPGTVRPIAWVREQGSGRVFYTALGHPSSAWTMPMDPNVPASRLVEDHVLPGLLWSMKRTP